MQVSTFEVLFSTSKFMYSASFDILPQSIHRFQKKPEVTPKRGLIALAVDTQSNKHGEQSGKASLSSDNIPGVSVNEELTD